MIKGNLKKIFLGICFTMAVVSGGTISNTANAATLSAAADSGLPYTDKPDIRLTRMNMPPIKAGETFTLSLKLSNISPAYSVNRGKLTLNVPESLNILDSSNSFFLDDRGIPLRSDAVIDIKMKASDKILTESIQIGATFEYTFWGRDGMSSGSENYTILVPSKKTDETAAKSAPVIQVVRDKIEPVEAKKSYDLDLKIKNINTTKAENVKITFAAGAGFTVKSRASNKFVKEIIKGEPITIPIKIKTAKTIETDSLELTVNLSYTYNQGGASSGNSPISDSEKILIPAKPTTNANEDGSMLTPNIIISKYDYGKKVEAGKTFDLSLKFKNTSKISGVENLVVSMNTGEGVSIAESSNSFYFEKLGIGQEIPLKIKLKAWEEAKSAAAIVTINFNYEYKNGKSIVKGSTTESISVPVVQPDRFELSDPTNEETCFVGQESTFSIPYVNKGKAVTSNISAKITGEGFDVISKDVWVGNCQSGASGSIDIILTPNTPGDSIAKVKVEYEDANGEKKSKDIEIPFMAQEQIIEQPEINPDEITEEKPTMNIKAKIAIALIVIVAVVMILAIIIKKLKKKAEASRMERLSKMYDWVNGTSDEKTSNEAKNDTKDDTKNKTD